MLALLTLCVSGVLFPGSSPYSEFIELSILSIAFADAAPTVVFPSSSTVTVMDAFVVAAVSLSFARRASFAALSSSTDAANAQFDEDSKDEIPVTTPVTKRRRD